MYRMGQGGGVTLAFDPHLTFQFVDDALYDGKTQTMPLECALA